MCFESVNKLPSFLSASNVDIDNHQVRSEAFHICEIFKNLAEQMNLEAKFLKKNREQLSDIFVILKNNNTPVHLPLLFSSKCFVLHHAKMCRRISQVHIYRSDLLQHMRTNFLLL